MKAGDMTDLDKYYGMTAEDTERYYHALGVFITKFADLETSLKVAAGALSGATPPEAMARFGTMTVSGCMEAIRKLCIAREYPCDEIIERAFEQLKLISTTRNSIIHQGADVMSGGAVTTLPGFRSPGQRREFDISPPVLTAMMVDLGTIIAAVDRLQFLVSGSGAQRDSSDFANLEWASKRRWRYNPTARA